MLSSSPAPCSIPILGPAAAAKHGCFPHAASHLEGNATTGDSSGNSACSTGICAANIGRGSGKMCPALQADRGFLRQHALHLRASSPSRMCCAFGGRMKHYRSSCCLRTHKCIAGRLLWPAEGSKLLLHRHSCCLRWCVSRRLAKSNFGCVQQ